MKLTDDEARAVLYALMLGAPQLSTVEDRDRWRHVQAHRLSILEKVNRALASSP